jgi:predicted transcriptional regulator
MATSLELDQDADKKQEKRDKLDLMLDLLTESSEPIKKTHLLYRMKINHAQLSRYLSLLLNLGMVEEISKPLDGFLITDKGRITLELFAKARNKGPIVPGRKKPDRVVYSSILARGC